jgi:hypothetical protein
MYAGMVNAFVMQGGCKANVIVQFNASTKVPPRLRWGILFCMKTCTKCGLEKDESEYYKRKDRPSGYTSHCKKCGAAECEKYRVKTRYSITPKKREHTKDGIKKCPGCQSVKETKEFYSRKGPSGNVISRSYCKQCEGEIRKLRIMSAEQMLHAAEKTRKWGEKNPDRVRMNSKNKYERDKTNLNDYYIRGLLKARGIGGDAIKTNPILVDLKRALVKGERIIKNKSIT